MLIYFGFTNCPDVCPTTLAVMGDALEKLGTKASAITPVFITTDPARDTPPVVAQYVKAFGPEFVGLTGDEKAIAAVEKAYRVYAKRRDLPGGGYSIDHSSVIYLMGPDGKYVRHYDEAISPDDLAKDLEKQL
jgi:protein SCO1/2